MRNKNNAPMNLRPAFFLFFTTLCLVALSSCITIIDSGSMLDDVGKQSPVHPYKPVQNKSPQLPATYEKEELQVWQKSSMYYVQIPVAYIPARIKNEDFLAGISMYMSCRVATYPSIKYNHEDLIKYPYKKEYFYAELTETQFRKASTPYTNYSDAFVHETYPLLSAAEVNLSNAGVCKLSAAQKAELLNNAYCFIQQLPDRRTTGNQWRRPLALLLDIADIPLSIILTPVAWGADFTYAIFTD